MSHTETTELRSTAQASVRLTAVMDRLRDLVVLLVALLVFGASSQSAVCEVECAMEVSPAGCSSATSPGQHLTTSSADGMDGSPSHCSRTKTASHRGDSAHGSEQQDGDCCKQASVWMSGETRAMTSGPRASQRTVVEVLPIALALCGSHARATETPPLRPLSADPLSVILRV
jgi:hypothetical protein